MKLFLRMKLDCPADAAWDALRSPRVFTQAMGPFARVRSLEKGGLPSQWQQHDEHRVAISLFGVLPMGTQTIDVAFTERPGGVRMLIDTGHAQRGLMSLIKDWDHRMAVSAIDDQSTLYRDRLAIKAGVLTPLIWFGLWFTWQYRGRRIRKLAKNWRTTS